MSILKKKEDKYELNDDISLCGVTKKITLGIEFTGTCQGLHKQIRVGFEVT